MMRQFKIVVPSFNVPDYIGKSLESIEKQDYRDYQVCVIDDGSSMKVQKEIILDFCTRNKWKYRFHDKNYGALYGLVHAVEDLKCHDDDVIIVLDGDDWFAHEKALTKWHQAYTENDICMTWGQVEEFPAAKTPRKFAQPVSNMVIEQRLYRDIPFVFYMGTYKYFLFRHINDKDLRDTDGEYFRILKDKATLFPMLEMAGNKIKFIPETQYIYNMANPLNDYRTNYDEFKHVDEILKNKPRYQVLDECK